jgi:hypothetical protein
MKGKSWGKIMLATAVLIVGVLLLAQAAAQKERTLVERVAALEAKVTELAERLSRLEGPVAREESKRVSAPHSPISMALVSKSLVKADSTAGDVSDRINFLFDLTSHLPKDIQGFIGVLVLKDPHNQELLEVELVVDDAVKAKSVFGGWQASIDYDPSLDTHRRLITIDQDDLRVELVVKEVLYADGTRETFSRE